ncbi:LacI family DNA-binding transcriptional regulator [Saccharopolyspora sp. 5N708]|uniref:LacI family DNA-binding transcriptional regulator n=1 Tax=Saccharopolyspora sp. 5N708 TaxID=3457424 RepID=UPI003FD66B96
MTADSSARATLNSVAKQAKVSRQTVSNVLNAPELVNPETRNRVRAVIEQQGYRPHRAARQLRTHRSQVIGLRIEAIGDGISGVVLDRFLHSLTATAEEHDHHIMLFTAPDDDAEVRAYGELVDTVGVDAFVLTGTHHGDARTQWLREHKLPFVTFGRPWGAREDHAWVDVDGATGTELATDHLIQRGHERIAFVGWPAGSGSGDDRRAGWQRAVRRAGLADDRTVEVADGIDGGRNAVDRLLSADPPTGFVCTSDSLALGVVSELRERGLNPGTDVAVTGFDDTPVAEMLGLTSVSQPIVEVAAQCIHQLQAVLRDAAIPEPALLAPRLVVRGTSG